MLISDKSYKLLVNPRNNNNNNNNNVCEKYLWLKFYGNK
jgi:hypothetical protein